MSDLVPCARCHRHIAADRATCPFCSVTIERPAISRLVARSARLSRVAMLAGVTACYTGTPSPSPPVRGDQAPPVAPTPPPDDTSAKPPVTGSGVIEGRLYDRDAQRGIAGILVMARRISDRDSHSTRTDATGSFSFANLPAGQYRVTVDHSGTSRPGMMDRVVDVVEGGVARTVFEVPVVERDPRRERSDPRMPYGAPPMRRRIT